jgi:hypothetical protein
LGDGFAETDLGDGFVGMGVAAGETPSGARP